MNKIFNNKIFLLLMFSVLFVLAFNCNSFAASNMEFTVYNQSDNSDVTLVVPSDVFKTMSKNKPYYFIADVSADYNNVVYNFCFSDRKFGVIKSGNYSSIYASGNCSINLIYFDKSSNNYIYNSSNSKLDSYVDFYDGSYFPFTSFNVSSIFASDNIYNYDKSNNVITDTVVFQGAPRAQVEPLMEITQVEEIQPAVAKIVGLVLPACLIIFGTLLVLYLIRSKNLLQV